MATTTQNPVIGPEGVAAVCRLAGFRGNGLRTIVAISGAESGFNAANTGFNSTATDQSIDRGLFQINNVYHPEVSSSCAYSPLCAAKAAFVISRGGTSFSPWTTFTKGYYHDELSAADAGIAKLQQDGGEVAYMQAHHAQLTAIYNSDAQNQAEKHGVIPVGPDNPLSTALGWADSLGKLLTNLLSRGFWIRALEIVGGLVLLAAGVILIGKTVANPL